MNNNVEKGGDFMLGYIFSAVVLVYFFVFWPANDNLPPRSMRTRRQRLAGKHGLHDTPSVGEIFLSSSHKEELVSCITFTDGATFEKIANSTHFYLVESRNSILSLYCAIDEPSEPVTYETLASKNFIRIQIEEHLLIRFLTELRPLRNVK